MTDIIFNLTTLGKRKTYFIRKWKQGVATRHNVIWIPMNMSNRLTKLLKNNYRLSSSINVTKESARSRCYSTTLQKKSKSCQYSQNIDNGWQNNIYLRYLRLLQSVRQNKSRISVKNWITVHAFSNRFEFSARAVGLGMTVCESL